MGLSLAGLAGIVAAPFTGGASLALMGAEQMWQQNSASRAAADARQASERSQFESMGFQERMSNTSYQRAVADMQAAGLNPMLAYSQGGASSPAGSSYSATPARTVMDARAISTIQSAAQVDNLSAQARATTALEDKYRAEAGEIRARTPTHAVSIERMQQDIRESVQRIEKSIAETKYVAQAEKTSAAQAALNYQHVQNLRAELPRIEQQIHLMRAQVMEAGQRTATGRAEEAKYWQLIKENLPEIERKLGDLKAKERNLDMPRRGNEAAVHDSFIGGFSALMKALNPLTGILTFGR